MTYIRVVFKAPIRLIKKSLRNWHHVYSTSSINYKLLFINFTCSNVSDRLKSIYKCFFHQTSACISGPSLKSRSRAIDVPGARKPALVSTLSQAGRANWANESVWSESFVGRSPIRVNWGTVRVTDLIYYEDVIKKWGYNVVQDESAELCF